MAKEIAQDLNLVGGAKILNLKTEVLSAAPSNATDGQMYLNQDGFLYIFFSSSWRKFVSFSFLDNILKSDFITNIFLGADAGKNNTPLSTTQGQQNTFIGVKAGEKNTTGYAKTNLGYGAGYSETTGNGNVNIGYQSGYNNEAGSFNTNLGTDAGARVKNGNRNIYIGWHSAFGFSTFATGDDNHLVGYETAINLLAGYSNAGFGKQVFYNLQDGYNNVAIGNLAGFALINGHQNTLLGKEAGTSLTNGNDNTFLGFRAGFYATTANNNIGLGGYSLFALTIGYLNIAVGENAGALVTTGSYNIFLGLNSGNVAGQKVDVLKSIAIGENAKTTKNYQAVIGSEDIGETVLRGTILIGTETNPSSAIVCIESTTKGFLMPRMTTTQINAIASPVAGLQVFNTTLQTICFYNAMGWQRVVSMAM